MRLDRSDRKPNGTRRLAGGQSPHAGASAQPQAFEPRLAAVLRPLVYFGGALTFAFPLATREAAWSIALGALAGAIVGRLVARSSLRSWTIALGGAALLACAGGLRSVLLSGGELAQWLGPARSLQVGDALGFGLGAFVIATVVRAAALRLWVLRVPTGFFPTVFSIAAMVLRR